MNANTLLLIVDMQYDFCSPEGALYVKGAEKDIVRLGKFISEYEAHINHIILTQDNHNVIDISHSVFWEDPDGNPPAAFTEISVENVLEGLWRPRFEQDKAIEYIRKLECQGEFPHVIWPEHCIIGSYGAAIADEIMVPVKAWARRGNFFDVVIKGTNPLTEHFGALMANVPLEDSPETQFNTALVDKLMRFENIFVAGEAKSHCVATTLKQMLNIDGLAQKLIILEDCMSDVPGFETIALPVYMKAREEGAKFISSIDQF